LPPKPFAWALRLDGFGAGFDWEVGPGQLPVFANHPGDVATGKLSARHAISRTGNITNPNTVALTFQIPAGAERDFYAQFSEPNYYLLPFPATITVGGDAAEVTGYDALTGTFTLNGTGFTGTLTEGAPFTISRTEPGLPGVLPCYFFENGSNEVEAWVIAFCEALASTARPANLPDPAAVVIGTEDFDLSGVDYLNYLDYLNDPKATNPTYRITGTHTLQQWDTAFATNRSGARLVIPPAATTYSPLNADVRSYLMNTLQTAYNYHRQRSTWQHFRGLWPRAHLSHYQLGNRYGVKGETEHLEVPFGPAESTYHGYSKWYGSVSWDAYYCITNPVHSPEFAQEDGRIVPLGYKSAQSIAGAATQSSGPFPSQFQGAVSGFNPATYLPGIRLFVQFTQGLNSGRIVEVTAWTGNTITLASYLVHPVTEGHTFIVYFPSFSGYDYFTGVAVWPLMETFCKLYYPTVDADTFLATSKRWAAEQARAQTQALPKNAYTVYYGPGSPDTVPVNTPVEVDGDPYDGVPERVSFLSTYPHEPFECKDGYLDGDDWGDVGEQAIDYGVNHFVWFVPDLVNENAPSRAMTNVATAMAAMHQRYMENRMIYQQIACIADWDQDATVEEEDFTKFVNDFLQHKVVTDLNNDGLFDQGDADIFDAAHQAGDCGIIAPADCDNDGTPDADEIANGEPDVNSNGIPDACENCDADWCQDGVVFVPDIFCFLTDWFANDPAARNFGGSPGVPAIFAFLSVWFANTGLVCPP